MAINAMQVCKKINHVEVESKCLNPLSIREITKVEHRRTQEGTKQEEVQYCSDFNFNTKWLPCLVDQLTLT